MKTTESQEDIDNHQPESESHAANDESTTKRHFEEEDSETEEKPRKKKKKKPVATVESSNKKGIKSIRQMKREKFLQREAEAEKVAKDQHKSQSLNYLSQWKHDRSNWRFMKAKQAWLYKNKFSSQLLPDSSWPLLLEYFESAKGNIRNMLLDDAKKIIHQMDEWTESQNNESTIDNEVENTEESTPSTKPDETIYKRARDLIQCLQE
ncbi:hypothetical protein K1T71_006231 [Dendrolimus kikuchii]|uniref:Uncharacterized protein n=1 Tax=Dendrolimus kikuchii TaxID=765133 RepID=A0ACC1D489_9NEOP|nr:hypothetical protein K1T71_006231 [Dendrolimus kikuchii]